MIKKTAHIEKISGIIRVFDEGCEAYKDEYEWCATLRWLEDDIVEVMGAMSAPTPSQWRAIKTALKDIGVKGAVFKRIREDGSTDIRRVSM